MQATLKTLERQQPLLGAADALEKRAQAIHEWPIDPGTFAWVITITTSVLAMTVGRIILTPLGPLGTRIENDWAIRSFGDTIAEFFRRLARCGRSRRLATRLGRCHVA